MSDEIYIIGAGAQGEAVLEAAELANTKVAGFFDDEVQAGKTLRGVKVMGSIRDACRMTDGPFIIAVGSNAQRKRIAGVLKGKRFATVIHPAAVVSASAKICEGAMLLAGAVVNANASVGAHCIINTNSVVEHNCQIGDFSHLSPCSALGGHAKLGRCVHIGIGACVRDRVSICDNAVLGAGGAAVCDISEPGIYAGVPAKRLGE